MTAYSATGPLRRRNRSRPAFSRSYPAVAPSVPTARADLVGFAVRAGASDEVRDAVELAASEALTNVVLHAYPAGLGAIHVSALVTADDLWVLIADDGFGFRADHESPGLGLGLPIITQMADEFVVVERSSGGLELRMRFALGTDGLGRIYPLGSFASATRPASPRFSTTT